MAGRRRGGRRRATARAGRCCRRWRSCGRGWRPSRRGKRRRGERPAPVPTYVERFDRRGTEPFELFKSEFGQNSVKIHCFLLEKNKKIQKNRIFQHFRKYLRTSDTISSNSEQHSMIVFEKCLMGKFCRKIAEQCEKV